MINCIIHLKKYVDIKSRYDQVPLEPFVKKGVNHIHSFTSFQVNREARKVNTYKYQRLF